MARRSSIIPGAMGLSTQSLDDLDTLIESLKVGTREFDKAMNVGAQMMAKITQGHAESLYRGPQYNVSGARANPSDFTIPVRRVTGKTYRGWRVKMVRFGAWECFNEERGAYMVEFGIVRGGGGKRRPILKMAGNAALDMAMRSRLGQRIYGSTFGELQMNKGKFGNFGRLQGGVYLS
jgi:hypothetical protein